MYDLREHQRAEIEQIVKAKGGTFVQMPEGLDWKESFKFVLAEVADAEVLLGWQINAEVLAKAKNLRWFHVPFAGVNRLIEGCPELKTGDIIMTNGSGTMSPPMADAIMGYIIMFNRQFLKHFRNQQKHVWEEGFDFEMYELSTQTLGIVGYGAIGKDVAIRAKPFGLRIIATKNNTAGAYPELDEVMPSSDLPKLLAESDYVLISAPLTPETHGLIGKKELEMMKPTAIIMNVGRGPIIKQAELIEALRENKIGGAALDVTDPEPLPADSPLWDMENVFITPHAIPASNRVPLRMVELFISNLKAYLNNQPLKNVVDVNKGY
jgi:phosphoglycerate dehydrogenase-like enzyme